MVSIIPNLGGILLLGLLIIHKKRKSTSHFQADPQPKAFLCVSLGTDYLAGRWGVGVGGDIPKRGK